MITVEAPASTISASMAISPGRLEGALGGGV
jgi:hypothetical protein